MGKLVIYLADGGTVDVVLDKERITIGRRPDNDVCLPFPAVSGEHAQVVTVLADSFLEDLGSTNGTIVNGKPVAKHFLRDRDAIDIGRQRLTYLVDDHAKVDALPPDMILRQTRGMPERVEGVKPMVKPTVSVGARMAPARQVPGAADLERVLAEAAEAAVVKDPTSSQPAMARAISSQVAPVGSDALGRSAVAAVPVAHAGGTGQTAALAPGAVASAAAGMPSAVPMAASASTDVPKSPPTASAPSVRVLSGASQGRTVAFPGPELTVGRVGVQVAVVRRIDGGGYLLIPLEGREPPRINGAAVAPEGSPLHPGDTFEVAGVRLELSVHS